MTARQPETHPCPCECGTQLPRARLACPAGWARLPEELRVALVTARAARRRCGSEQERQRRAAVLSAARSRVLDWYHRHPPSSQHGRTSRRRAS